MNIAMTRTETHAVDRSDAYRGTSVVIAARWLLVAAGLAFVLYRPQSTMELSTGVVSILAIAVSNFWLQMRPLRNQSVVPLWAWCASAADLLVISGLLFMQGDASGKAFAFYYPAVVAYSLVFPGYVNGLLTGGARVLRIDQLEIDGGEVTVDEDAQGLGGGVGAQRLPGLERPGPAAREVDDGNVIRVPGPRIDDHVSSPQMTSGSCAACNAFSFIQADLIQRAQAARDIARDVQDHDRILVRQMLEDVVQLGGLDAQKHGTFHRAHGRGQDE